MAMRTVQEPLALANVFKYDMPVAPPLVFRNNPPKRREHV